MIDWFEAASHFVHRRFIWLLLASYLVAGVAPGPGLAIRSVHWGTISLPMLMLGFLLLNAGMGVAVQEIGSLRRNPLPLILGLLANLAIPIAFIFLVMQTMKLWHNPDEVQNILVGLALVASMPIAGSSAAWSQNANGSLALSLGLVLGSTLLSPLTTPIALHAVGLMTTGDYSEDLHELAGTGTGMFLAVAVIVPSVLGIVARLSIGAPRAAKAKPYLKFANSIILLLLNYANGAVSLPQAVREHDWDFLAANCAIALLLCGVGFVAGWAIARLRQASLAERIALMFGLGMNNNGAGLVLASLALADHPRVLLPIIFYNLVQHLVAGVAQFLMLRNARQPDAGSTALAAR